MGTEFKKVVEFISSFDCKDLSVNHQDQIISARFVYRNSEDVDKFIHSYSEETKETLRILRTKNVTSKSQYSLVKYYRCQHQTRNKKTREHLEILKQNPSKRLQNTDCAFSLNVKIIKKANETHPCTITIKWTHNHPTEAAQALSYRDVPEEVRQKILELFAQGYTPSKKTVFFTIYT